MQGIAYRETSLVQSWGAWPTSAESSLALAT
jgi:hypothetical protein